MFTPRRDPQIQSFSSLTTPYVADALAEIGVGGAPAGLLPLWAGSGRIVGRAITVRLVPAEQADMCPQRGTLEALRSASEGDLLVIDARGDASVPSLAGIAAYAAQRLGVVGCVVDGAVRNVDEMEEVHFPVFGRAAVQIAPRSGSACAGYGSGVELSGVPCRPGDVVLADVNGVVVVPQEHAARVLELAHSFLGADNRVKDAIARGVDPLEALEKRDESIQRNSA